MGQAQSGEGHGNEGAQTPEDSEVEFRNEQSQTSTATTPNPTSTNNKQQKSSNNQRAAMSKKSAPRLDNKGRYKRNLLSSVGVGRGGRDKGGGTGDKMTLAEHQHVRKLSNVSNRNIQLLSMKPRSEQDNYADGIRLRRRSSLINLILGAPSRGPRFSDDLCSLSSHMSELCNFGIDYFPDAQQHQQYGYPVQANRTNSSTPGSTLSRLDDNLGSNTLRPNSLAISGGGGGKHEHVHHHHHAAAGDFVESSLAGYGDGDATASSGRDASRAAGVQRHRRRRSSLGSLSTFEGPGATALQVQQNLKLKLESEQQHVSVENSDSIANNSPSATSRQLAISHATPAGQQQHQFATPQQTQTPKHPILASMFLASIDLGSSVSDSDSQHEHEEASRRHPSKDSAGHYRSYGGGASGVRRARQLVRSKQTTFSESSDSGCSQNSQLRVSSVDGATNGGGEGDNRNCFSSGPSGVSVLGPTAMPGRGRINHNARRIIHRSGSELSLYSLASGSLSHNQLHSGNPQQHLARSRHISQGSIGSIMLEAGWDTSKKSKGMGGLPRNLSSTLAHQVSSGGDGDDRRNQSTGNAARLRETKWIIMLQVCLPFILAGFGNMAAGLVLNEMAQWEAFNHVPIFFVLLPSFVGLKGNIEMTLASRLSTLSNLNLLDTGYQRRHAFLTNLVLILSQAIGLSIFAAFASVLCEFSMGKLELDPGKIIKLSAMVVLPCALVTSIFLATISSIVMWLAIWMAKRIQVNPDNLSTLVAALYGDVSCVLTYGLFAQLMYSLNQRGIVVWPLTILCGALISWPILWYVAYKSKETRDLSLSSMPPMLAAILVSLGSGAVLSLVVGRFSRIALYQPVVNGFGANLIAVQASRVSTWLWCNALRKLSTVSASINRGAANSKPTKGFEFEPSMTTTAHDKPMVAPYGSLASFTTTKSASNSALAVNMTNTTLITTCCHPVSSMSFKAHKDKESSGDGKGGQALQGWREKQTLVSRLRSGLAFAMKLVKLLLWSFCNSSPNSVAARLLLVMLIPAHSLYFIVIWMLSPPGYVTLTWLFYFSYVGLCLTQVFILLLICEPMMTFLMSRRLDPDIFGISLLMALADLIGTLCLTGAFMLLAGVNDPNA